VGGRGDDGAVARTPVFLSGVVLDVIRRFTQVIRSAISHWPANGRVSGRARAHAPVSSSGGWTCLDAAGHRIARETRTCAF
jgi:hypothetical protein